MNPDTSAKRYRTVTFTDLEKKANGHPTGRYSKTFTVANYPPGELESLIVRMREEQAKKNTAFKQAQFQKKKEEGEPPEALGRSRTIRNRQETLPVESLDKPKASTELIAPPEASPILTLRLDPGTGNSTALLGSSKQGKSTCMMHLYRQHYTNQDHITTLFASNPQIPLYGEKRLIISPTYEPKVIKLAASINRKTGNRYEFCFLLDDIVDKRDDVVLKELILTLRNSNLSSIVCLQYGNLLAKVARANVNNLLLFGFNSDEAIELICQQYLATHLRQKGIQKQDWGRYYREATRDHGFIYVHPSSNEVSYHRLPALAATKTA